MITHVPGLAVLFTGLPAAGKSTLAETVRRMLQPRAGRPTHLLDGDTLRRDASSDLGYTRADRDEHVRRVGERAAELVRSGGVVLCALIAPYDAARKAVRRCLEPHGAFVLVHVSTPLAICEGRDPKGLYAKARAGSLAHFTGLSDPYEAPVDADLTIDTATMTAEQAGRTVVDYLRQRGLIERGDEQMTRESTIITIGVVIPCRNEAKWIRELLSALRAQDHRPDQIIVVDDQSTDGTADAVEQWRLDYPDTPVRLAHGAGRGIAAAVNTGIGVLDADVIVRLDGHCLPAGDYVRRTVELVEQPGVGVAGGAWTIVPGAPTLEARAIAIAVQHPLGSGGAAYRRPAGGELRTSNFELQTVSVDTVPFGAFRRSLWAELGGLDERLHTNEDYDFNFRVRESGLKVMLDPTIRCTYYARPTIAALARQYFRYGWWKARMLLHHPRSLRWRQAIPIALVPALVVGAIAIIGGRVLVSPWPLAAYPAVIIAGALHAASPRRAWSATPWIAAAFFVIQIVWSAGFWASLLSPDQDTKK